MKSRLNRTRSLGRARTKDQWPSKRLDYGLIFHEMEVGFAIHEMIFDAGGRPLDYRFLDANPAYERITGLRVADIRGKRVREVLPGIEERWIETYGRVVTSGEPKLFTDYAETLGRYFEVWAYRPAPGRFVVMIRDVSEKQASENAVRRQASVLRAVLGSIDTAVAFKGLDGLYLGCNPEYTRLFGTSEAQIIGMSDGDLYEPDKAARIGDEDRAILASGKAIGPHRVWIQDAAGRERLCDLSKLPLVAEGGSDSDRRPFGIAILWHDTGDAALTEKSDAIHMALVRRGESCTSDEILAMAVQELESAIGSELGFIACLEEGGSYGFVPSLGDGAMPMIRGGIVEQCAQARRPLILEGGAAEGGRALLIPIIRKGEVVGVLGLANKASPYNNWDLDLGARVADSVWEIFERKRAQEKAYDSAQQRDLAISAMKAGVETWFIEEDRKEYDERWAGILGYARAELPADSMKVMQTLAHPGDYKIASERLESYLSGASDSYEAEMRMRHRDGRWVWVLQRAQIVERGAKGEPLRLSGLIIDISGLKEVEERLRRTLSEKEILLQELFHRTKNTMQLINAMLELKKQGLESSPFSLAIEGVQSKIIAMSLVQEKLYHNADLSVLDLGDYITELMELLKEGAPIGSGNVRISSETEAVPVSVDAAIPCGLIITELVSNALAHAFPGGVEGSIVVSLSQAGGEIVVAVQDNGVGLPEGYDIDSSERLGLRTVKGIGEEQLRGRVEFDSCAGGFCFRLTFKDSYYPRRL